MKKVEFNNLQKSHLLELGRYFLSNMKRGEDYGGAWGILEDRRPFGRSGVEGRSSDILDILNIHPDDGKKEYSDRQLEYAEFLWAHFGDFMRDEADLHLKIRMP